MSTPSPAVAEPGDARAASEFTSTIPFADDEPDCLVISCSDHRFREHVRELLAALGLKRPHLIAVPGGVLLSTLLRFQ